MRLAAVLILIWGGMVTSVSAQTKWAFIVGIDKYRPPANATIAQNTGRSGWSDLDGCVNDATAVKDMTVSKYGFKQENIKTLFNEDASREKIMAEFANLISDPKIKKGDVVFIYYAGHGSQVKNSLSLENDKKDESMVPADVYNGADDIRDKELAAVFNKLIDKGVLLTVIFDSCHSGSVGRGATPNDPPKVRYMEGSTRDAKDPSNPARPEDRGALIISAAQDFEFAKEQRDENDIPHGAFTIALLKALQQQSADATVSNIFTSITAIMKYYGKTQEPVLAANNNRKEGTLFGLAKGSIKNTLAIGVSKIESRRVELLGGYAFGLAVGNKLAGMNSKDTLEITEMSGANRSFARVLTGDPAGIKPGTLFEVINWASSGAPALNVYIPPAAEEKMLNDYVSLYQSAKKGSNVSWTADITKSSPSSIYYYNKDGWMQNNAKGTVSMGKSPQLSSIQKSMGESGSVFVSFPPSVQLNTQLRKQFESYNNIRLVSDPNDSQYTLMGRLNNKNGLEYALIKSQATLQDSTESLPDRTDFVPYTGTAESVADMASKLSEYAFRISKIRDWLMLPNPRGTERFPFKLGMEYYSSNKPLTSDRVKINDTLSVFFKGEPEEMMEWNRKKRYVYVFSIDSKGAMNLLYPDAASGNIENQLPVTNEQGNPVGRTHIADILITPPVGADNYFMLSSEEPINNLSAFQQEGVLSRGETKGRGSALEGLLFTGTKTRSQSITPVNWSINKLILRTYE